MRISLFLPKLYLIEILHQTTTSTSGEACVMRCILSKFYIKPQLALSRVIGVSRCILSKFYIKPQLYKNYYANKQGCILSKFYIKPQQGQPAVPDLRVVSYRNSTSNHNRKAQQRWPAKLYLIEILHQTTTSGLILIDKVLLTGCLPL